MMRDSEKKHWLTSNEIRKVMKISGCELMHRRESGELEFKKVGNAFYYMLPVLDAVTTIPTSCELDDKTRVG